jgi:hypothetical protein
VGDGNERPAFAVQGIGPAGGTVAAGDVWLGIPPGALTTEVAVSILPQATPLPLSKQPGDPCTYTFLGPLWCCGPVGHPLLVKSRIIIDYDPALIPAGKTQNDLILLVWNDAAGAFFPDPTANHNLAANQFEKTDLMELGHIAVGVRDCPVATAPGFVVIVNPPQIPIIAGVIGGAGVYVGSVEPDDTTFVQVAGGAEPFSCVASPDGQRILMSVFDQSESSSLISAPVDGSAAATLVDGNQQFFNSSEPQWGWLTGTSDVYFIEFVPASVMTAPVPRDTDPTRNEEVVFALSGAGGGTPRPIQGVETSGFIRDLRQSADGSLLMIRRQVDFQGSPDEITIVQTATGTMLSQGDIPAGNGQHTPRFLPDNSGVYYVADNLGDVVRVDLDGTSNMAVLWACASEFDEIQDAVISPDGETLAIIVRQNIGSVPPPDTLCFIDLNPGGTAAAIENVDLTGNPSYDEVIFNPLGSPLYIATSRGAITPYSVDAAQPEGSRITVHPVLPAPVMRYLDINAVTGELLHVLPEFGQSFDAAGTASTRSTSGPGICISDAFGANIQDVDGPPGLPPVFGRWLRSIRRVPGDFPNFVR